MSISALSFLENHSPQTRFLVGCVREASEGGKTDLRRWDGLRRFSVEAPNGTGTSLLLPLPNDGSLSQQLLGLSDWMVRLAPSFSVPADEARLAALAYTARQIRGQNILFNMQTPVSRGEDGARIRRIADGLFLKEDGPSHSVFARVARFGEVIEKTDPLLDCLSLARFSHALETGVRAVEWVRSEASPWSVAVAHVYNAEAESVYKRACDAALRLGANAFGNAVPVLKQAGAEQVVTDLLQPLYPVEREAIADSAHYNKSLSVSMMAVPSYDRSTPAFGARCVFGS